MFTACLAELQLRATKQGVPIIADCFEHCVQHWIDRGFRQKVESPYADLKRLAWTSDVQ